MNYQDIEKSQYTPMMQQYLDIKKDYVDTLVFFRLGDFYEMFFNDAHIASKELEIALTGRDAGTKERVPMCGVPYHAVNVYIEKLISKGYKIAIVEQLEEPKPGKTIVKRGVIRLITPGTLIDNGSIIDNENNFIVAVSENKSEYLISYADFSIGDNYITSIPKDIDLLVNEILLIGAKEVIVNSNFKYADLLIKKYQIFISYEDEINIPSYLKGLAKHVNDIDYINCFGRLLNYLIKTQKRELLHLKPVEYYDSKQFLKMDIHTVNNLELMINLRNGTKAGSLLDVIDKTQTAMGSREIKKWLTRPLLSKNKIIDRLDLVESLIEHKFLHDDLISYLKTIYDLERIVGRIAYKNANARDLIQLKNSLENIPKIKEIIHKLNIPYSIRLSNEINPLGDIFNLLTNSLDDDAPITVKEGKIIKEGYHEDLDKIKKITKNGRKWILEYEQKEKEKTGIKTLKVGYNRVFGYYLEVSKGALSSLTEDLGYERKQTIANAERFVTNELKEYENMILNSHEKSIELEYELFCEIRDIVSKSIIELQKLASIIATIDALSSFAEVSVKNNYIKPIINDTREINIVNGRHPVVELIIDDVFIKNDIIVNKYNTLLITGPNMSGKSTYMRQLAMMVIMMQIGCFVPSDSARIPIFDQIFTRIGASDDLVKGQSTFMVEMLEVKNALVNATSNSLILFDEIGRGTATYDGMALAQAIIEYVHEKIGCITFFSTHYHELTNLENTLKRLKNIHVMAKEEKGGVVFLHKVMDGKTDKSYGINVAFLAKLPPGLIYRAKNILNELEETKGKIEIKMDLFNFDEYHQDDKEHPNNEIINQIESLNLENMTPLDALNFLNEIKKKI